MQSFYKVLIVDDEIILRNGLRHLFHWEEYGFRIVGEAANGEEALSLIEQYEPHILITDIVMPVMDGVELVKQLHTRYPHIKTVILSSFSEFKYVREAFKYGISDYLLKPTLKANDMIMLLQGICKQLMSAPVSTSPDLSPKMLLEQLLTASDKEPLYEKLRANYPLDSFLLLKTSLAKVSQDAYLNKSQLESSLHTLFATYLHPFQCIDAVFDHEYVILINLSMFDEVVITSHLNALFSEYAEAFRGLLFVSTHAFSDITQIVPLYHQLNEPLSKSFYFNGRKLVFDTEILPSVIKQEFNLKLFLDHIKILDLEAAKDIVYQYFQQLEASQSLDEYSFKRFCQNVLYNLLNTLHHLGFDVSHLNQNKLRLFKSIDTALYIEDIYVILAEVFEQAPAIVSMQADQKNSIILKKVFEYVDQHFDEEITLSDIANKLHINYYYLSSYFKSHTHENLTAYISKVRVEKAKVLLTNPQLSIAEVSAQVGFSEHNYFCKVFKKYTTYTPSSYRSKLLGDSNV